LKFLTPPGAHEKLLSSPSRGTWVEIMERRQQLAFLPVVPLAGDVG